LARRGRTKKKQKARCDSAGKEKKGKVIRAKPLQERLFSSPPDPFGVASAMKSPFLVKAFLLVAWAFVSTTEDHAAGSRDYSASAGSACS
jgi:hypothetical protein